MLQYCFNFNGRRYSTGSKRAASASPAAPKKTKKMRLEAAATSAKGSKAAAAAHEAEPYTRRALSSSSTVSSLAHRKQFLSDIVGGFCDKSSSG